MPALNRTRPAESVDSTRSISLSIREHHADPDRAWRWSPFGSASPASRINSRFNSIPRPADRACHRCGRGRSTCDRAFRQRRIAELKFSRDPWASPRLLRRHLRRDGDRHRCPGRATALAPVSRGPFAGIDRATIEFELCPALRTRDRLPLHSPSRSRRPSASFMLPGFAVALSPSRTFRQPSRVTLEQMFGGERFPVLRIDVRVVIDPKLQRIDRRAPRPIHRPHFRAQTCRLPRPAARMNVAGAMSIFLMMCDAATVLRARVYQPTGSHRAQGSMNCADSSLHASWCHA